MLMKILIQIVLFISLLLTYKLSTLINKPVIIDKQFLEDAIDIANVISIECGNCPIIDKQMVASSIINRKKNISRLVRSNQYKKLNNHLNNISDEDFMVAYKSLITNYNKEVIYFINPKKVKDKKFLKFLKGRRLILKTNKQCYYA